MIDPEKLDVDAGFPKARSALVNNFILQIDCEHSRSVSITGRCHFSFFLFSPKEKKNNTCTYLLKISMFNDHHQTVTIFIPLKLIKLIGALNN